MYACQYGNKFLHGSYIIVIVYLFFEIVVYVITTIYLLSGNTEKTKSINVANILIA